MTDLMELASREAQADIEFLLDRADRAGSCSFGGKRWTGISSNALVAIAYGRKGEDVPFDGDDLAACYRAIMRLPEHRRIAAVFDHLEKGEAHVEKRTSCGITWAREASEWPGRAALETTPTRAHQGAAHVD